MTESTAPTTLHRALADPRRARIVSELESTGEALDATELGARVGLHPNTVRWHLGVLADAGLVHSYAAPRQTPGRPRILYALDPAAAAAGRDDYRLLATVLAAAVGGGPDAAAASERAGREWGRDLVRSPEPSRAHGDDGSVDAVVRLLAERGFEPTADGLEIEMHRCPFLDLAGSHPEVVCAVHRGVVDGALGELDSELAVAALDVFPAPDVCVLRLSRRPVR
jgi:predicted ArsR family transcriptional regulator